MDKIYEPIASFHDEWGKYTVEEVLTWNKNHPHIKIYNKYIALYCEKHKKNKKDLLFLDAGCGIGRLIIYYKQQGYKILGTDIISSALQKAKRYDPTMNMVHADIRKLPVNDSTVDVYFSVGVIEHDIRGPQAILQEAQRILKKEGLLLINIPIMNNFYKMFWPFIKLYETPFIENIIRRAFGKKPIHKKHFDHFLYDKHEFEGFIRKSGFKIIRVFPTMHVPGVAKACPLFLNRGKDKDTTGNSPYFLNKAGRFVYTVTKNFPWLMPNCCFIVAEKP